ncbi:tetratricopeptide repeat protein [Ekhidna sp.]|jgi:two-component sensor histidine kinase|uniref:tetratricopeptide repeat-containing sensor histidine kinase n=1 Tax=Ekhidna sp. TaxID=2608089 RepID=UPI0032EB5273
MKLILIIFLFFNVSLIYSQELIELKNKLTDLHDLEFANTARKIGTAYLKQGVYDSADKYYDLAIEKAIKIRRYDLAGKSLNNKGVSKYQRGLFIDAIDTYQKAIHYYELSRNDTLVAKGKTNLGLTFKGLNLYEKALENLYSSAKVLEQLDLKKELSSNWNALGNLHRDLGNSDQSLEYLTNSLNLRIEIDYEAGVAQSFHNIGIWYLAEDSIPRALAYFEKSLGIKRKLRNRKSTATTLAQTGEAFMQLDSFKLAEDYFLESLILREESQDQFGIAVSSNHLANVYLVSGKMELAKKYLDKALKFVLKGNFLGEKARTYEALKIYHAQNGNFLEALNYSDLLANVRQEILNEEKSRSFIESEIRYEVYRKDQEILENRNSLILLKERSIWLIVIVIFLTILVLVIVRLYVLSQRILSHRKKSQERIEGLLQELHHRTKNHLQAQSSLIKLQSNYLKDKHAKDVMMDVSNRMKAVTLVHQSLHFPNEKETLEEIDLSDYLKKLTENLLISFGTNNQRIQVEYKLQTVRVNIYSAVPIGLFVNEAITNAFKHAYSGIVKPRLLLELSEENSTLIICVSDNGNGLPDISEKKHSFGITTMRDLAVQLRGKFTFESVNGTQVRLTIPN